MDGPSNGKIKFNEDLVHPTRTRHGNPAFLCSTTPPPENSGLELIPGARIEGDGPAPGSEGEKLKKLKATPSSTADYEQLTANDFFFTKPVR
uniref:Uncharacterized protein n=1 Tax=Solanum lycopersicum TaxID=4081 RepID=A0A3Q7EEB4_SOLLC